MVWKNVNRSPTYLFKWLVTCGNYDLHMFVSQSFLRITNRKPITKNQHQKHNVVWTAPFWIIVDTFTASHGFEKMWTDSTPIFLNDLWHVENYDLHMFVSRSFLRVTNRKPITKETTSKTTCCLNSTLLNHSGHFYSIPWKNKLIEPELSF